jgi:hypothetical protein
MGGMTASWACEEPGPVPGSGRLAAGVLLNDVGAGVATCLGFDPPAMIIPPSPASGMSAVQPPSGA